jgi:hypothetical protein
VTLYRGEAGPLEVALIEYGAERRVRIWNPAIPGRGLLIAADTVPDLIAALRNACAAARRAER